MKLKNTLLLSISLIITVSISSQAQTSKMDSLKQEIQILKLKAQIDSLKLVNKTATSASQTAITNEDYEARQDALKKDFMNLNNELRETKLNLDACHKQFRTGVIAHILGYASLAIGTYVVVTGVGSGSSQSRQGSALIGTFLYLAGAGGLLAGHIIMIDSHKHIGYAGQRKYIKTASDSYVK